jgi:hypothetical protein
MHAKGQSCTGSGASTAQPKDIKDENSLSNLKRRRNADQLALLLLLVITIARS